MARKHNETRNAQLGNQQNKREQGARPLLVTQGLRACVRACAGRALAPRQETQTHTTGAQTQIDTFKVQILQKKQKDFVLCFSLLDFIHVFLFVMFKYLARKREPNQLEYLNFSPEIFKYSNISGPPRTPNLNSGKSSVLSRGPRHMGREMLHVLVR